MRPQCDSAALGHFRGPDRVKESARFGVGPGRKDAAAGVEAGATAAFLVFDKLAAAAAQLQGRWRVRDHARRAEVGQRRRDEGLAIAGLIPPFRPPLPLPVLPVPHLRKGSRAARDWPTPGRPGPMGNELAAYPRL